MKLKHIKVGDSVLADGGFTCMKAGPKDVKAGNDGRLYIECDEGKHLLEGQVSWTSDELVGISASCPAESI